MAAHHEPFGLSCALATPFLANGECDLDILVEHARSRLSLGCGSITVFGTTGEGASLGAEERRRILASLKSAGFDFRREVVVCCSASAIGDAVAQIKTALSYDCRAILLPPPFYFKNVSEDGLFDWFSACFAHVGPDLRDVILYHIPSVTEVPVPLTLVQRLKAAHPTVVYGVKDSGGDWNYSSALLAENPDLTILIGDERHLGRAVPLGAEGAISGTANLFPEILLPLIEKGRTDERVIKIVDEILRFPVTPAVKALLAHRTQRETWRRVASPLRPLSEDQSRQLSSRYDEIIAQ